MQRLIEDFRPLRHFNIYKGVGPLVYSVLDYSDLDHNEDVNFFLTSIGDFFQFIHPEQQRYLNSLLEEFRSIKFTLIIKCLMLRQSQLGPQVVNAYFRSKLDIMTQANLNELINNAIEQIIDQYQEYNTRGSGWQFLAVKKVSIESSAFAVMRGGSFIPTPEGIPARSTINVHNYDDKCLVWAILSGLYRAERNPDRVSHYMKYESELNLEGIEYPATLSNIELQNHMQSMCSGMRTM